MTPEEMAAYVDQLTPEQVADAVTALRKMLPVLARVKHDFDLWERELASAGWVE